MKSTFFITLFVSCLFAVNAQKQERQVGAFEGIEVAGHYTVQLVQGTEGKVLLEGASDDLDQIETYLKRGVLIIKKKNTSWYKSWKSGKVKITVPIEELSEVALSGSGSIHADHLLEAEEFRVTLSGSGEIDLSIEAQEIKSTLTGSGDLTLSGNAAEVYYQLTGSGDIYATALKSEKAEANITGSGDIEMHSSDQFSGSITGSGDIVCYGNPEKQQIKTTGSGDVMIRN